MEDLTILKKLEKKRNDFKNSKNIFVPSLMLWALWGHFQGGYLCLIYSVCWFFRLTSSVVLWGGLDAAKK